MTKKNLLANLTRLQNFLEIGKIGLTLNREAIQIDVAVRLEVIYDSSGD